MAHDHAAKPPSHNEHGSEHGHPSLLVYWGVFGALLVLTVVTYLTGRMHLGAAALPLALAIASTKAGLVVAFFMHLYYTRGGPLISFTVSVLFVLTLIAGVFGDIVFRYPLARPDHMVKVAEPPIGYSLGEGPDGHAHGKTPMGNPHVPQLQNP